MKKTFPEPILNQSISELELTEKFKELTHKYQLNTLGDILNLKQPYDLLRYEGFDQRSLMEFSGFLTKNKLGHYLMPV